LAGAFLLTALAAIAPARNAVDLTHSHGDTIWSNVPGYISIWIENDVKLSGISMGYYLYSPDGATWTFQSVPGAFPVVGGGQGFIKGVAGSRWMTVTAGDGSCWDLGGTMVKSDLGPNQFLVGGAALASGLQPGPMQRMLEVYLTPSGVSGYGDFRLLCMDSAFYPPSSSFIFVSGSAIIPEISHRCWPVTLLLLAGDADASGDVNLADAVYIINYVFSGGPEPSSYGGDPNGDCAIDLADAVYLIEYIFRGGPEPQPGCAK
jgi:hypothetical protein